MPEENKEEFFNRALKKFSTKEIEAIIAKALSNATEKEYEANISEINYELHDNSFMYDETKITITIKNKEEDSTPF